MTNIVDITHVMNNPIIELLRISHFVIKLTVGGINNNGIMDRKKSAVSSISSSLMTFVQRAVNRMTKPYILAGIGRGTMMFNNSPMKVMMLNIVN